MIVQPICCLCAYNTRQEALLKVSLHYLCITQYIIHNSTAENLFMCLNGDCNCYLAHGSHVLTLPCSSFIPVCCNPSSALLRQNRFNLTPSVVLLSPCCYFCVSLLFSLSLFFFIPPIHFALQWQVFKEQLHTRVVLVAVEIWTDKDHIPISVRPLEMLRDFAKYRQQSIKHHADAVHLIS